MSRELRQIKKQKASRPKQSLGRTTPPIAREGIGGDIRVRQSDKGPVIEAKLGNEWFGTPLSPITSSPNTGISKVWVHDGITPNKYHWVDGSGTGSDVDNAVGEYGDEMFVPLPDFINAANITGINFMINMGGTHYHAWSWDTAPQFMLSRSNSGYMVHPANRVEVSYHRKEHEIALLNIGYIGPSTGSKNSKFKLAVYYF